MEKKGYLLKVRVYENADLMGAAAAEKTAEILKPLTAKRKPVLSVFAAAPSQDTFLKHLCRQQGIDWSRVTAFHLDEYLDLPRHHPNTFETYLNKHIFEKIPLPESNIKMIKSLTGTPDKIADTYGSMLKESVDRVRGEGGIYIAFIGIGVNGHIAFNEPGTNIYSSRWVLPVEIDNVSVKQQFDDYKNHPDPDARYATLEDVPRKALTMSCAAILEADVILCIVPGKQKADAVQKSLEGPVTPDVPASLLRKHRSTTIFLDRESAGKLSPPPSVQKTGVRDLGLEVRERQKQGKVFPNP